MRKGSSQALNSQKNSCEDLNELLQNPIDPGDLTSLQLLVIDR